MAPRSSNAKSELERRQAINKTTAIIIPLILIGLIGYATWVVVVLVAAHYLINGHSQTESDDRRPATGIAIIVVYFVLLLPCAVVFLRLLGSVREPGYVDTGKPSESTNTVVESKEQSNRQVARSCTSTHVATRPQTAASQTKSESELSSIGPHGQQVTTLDLESIFRGEVPPPAGLEKYYTKDVFACDPNGLPVWCGTCCNWKPDRSHHCSDVGRCVMKLDHFCPWVGGVVAENNFKWFIQFTSYTCLYTLYILIVMAYFVHDRSARGWGIDVNWVITLALGGLFALFTGGMAGTSIHLALNNLTTIDNIDHERRTMFLAVHIRDPAKYYKPAATLSTSGTGSLNPVGSTTNRTAKAEQRARSLDRSGFEPGECTRLMFKGSAGSRHRTKSPERNEPPPHPWTGSITYPLYTRPVSSNSQQGSEYFPPPRTFAILRTRPGMNPWDLGPSNNWKSVMGNQWFDWFLPLRYSPCRRHDRDDTLYDLGPDLDRLKREAGIDEPTSSAAEAYTEKHRRKKHRKVNRRRSDESPDSMAASTLANVDGFAGRNSAARPSSSSSH